MEWSRLLTPVRAAEYQKTSKKRPDLRTEFEKDYHRIIGSAAFRRLQDKTQVFPLDKSDFIRTRLTHSLEVSSLAKSLGQNVGESIIRNHLDPGFTEQMKSDICDILQCAGLIHDIGNPPFGHFGEEAIRDWFRKNLPELTFKGQKVTELFTEQMRQDFYRFEGNAQALRLVSKLHYLVNEYGMNQTLPLLNTIIKYPVPSDRPMVDGLKFGWFCSEEQLYRRISERCGTEGMRHPLTFLLEAADDIAYCTADIEDAVKKQLLSLDTLLAELHRYLDPFYGETENYTVSLLEDQYRKAVERHDRDPIQHGVSNFIIRLQGYFLYCATSCFSSHYREIMDGSWRHDIFRGTPAAPIMDALRKIAYDHAFISTPILKLEVAADRIISYLLESFVNAVLYYDTDIQPGMMEDKFINLISENYRQIYHFYSSGKPEDERLYLRLLLVTDYVSGMTDTYARDLYRELNGIG